ncbi:MAG: hypothetical protein M0023_04860 [Desulfobacteraceae bacterium]|nr:hypothetical protein [Desulfobacteraceae bacterium]
MDGILFFDLRGRPAARWSHITEKGRRTAAFSVRKIASAKFPRQAWRAATSDTLSRIPTWPVV